MCIRDRRIFAVAFAIGVVSGIVLTFELGLNWAKLSPGFRNINVLTSEKLTDMGNSATFYSVLVEVELSRPSQ